MRISAMRYVVSCSACISVHDRKTFSAVNKKTVEECKLQDLLSKHCSESSAQYGEEIHTTSTYLSDYRNKDLCKGKSYFGIIMQDRREALDAQGHNCEVGSPTSEESRKNFCDHAL